MTFEAVISRSVLTRRSIAVALAAVGIAIGAEWHGAAAQDRLAQNPLAESLLANATRDVRAALQACWIAPADEAARQVLVRLGSIATGRSSGSLSSPSENPQPSEEGRAAIRDALAQALTRCAPLPLSDAFRKVIAVHPITVRLGDGWRRRPTGRRP
jgi:hypothetical protein